MDTSVVAANDGSNEIKPKMHFTGTVERTTLPGAFINIGMEVPGFLHISQLESSDEQPVKRVEDVLQIGQQVEVWVRKVKDDRIELTMKKPLDLEWRDLKKGMNVKGTVTKLEKYGAFVEIGAERPGLIHISEMAHGYVRAPGDVVKEGDEVEAQVLDVNRRKKQIKLSLKALQEEPVKEAEAPRPAEGTQRSERPARRKKSRSDSERGEGRISSYEESTPSTDPDPTAMEIALREAMEKANARKKEDKSKRGKNVSKEQEEILNRTLENKVRTS